MVRLAAPVAINRDDAVGDHQQAGETAEVIERRIQAEYDKALEQQRHGNTFDAQALFKKLLAEPALQNVDGGSISNLAHARYLVLKNLAGSLAAEDSTCEEALHLYVEASELDSSDAVLWHRLGSLASELGHWSLARHALESGLRCNPHHFIIQNKLLEVLLALADWQSLSSLRQLMLHQNPGSLRAVKVLSTLQHQQQPDKQLRLTDASSPEEDDLLDLQPQLKRRCIPSPQAQSQPTENSIALQKLTWKQLTAAVCKSLTDAASKGRPSAALVTFALPEAASMPSENDMVYSPPAVDAVGSWQVPASTEIPLGESDNTTRQESEAEDKAKPDVVPAAVPQRASRRLGSSRAATEVCSDHESPELTKNVVELLSPFLPPQPKKAGSQPAVSNDADAATAAAAAAADFPASPSVLSTEVEHAQVQAFVDKQAANSGLQAVAASLLNTLFSGQSKAVALDLAEDVMQLEAAVQGWKHTPVVALSLAELYFQALVRSDPSQSAIRKSKGNAQNGQSKPDQLMSSCIVNVGMFETALLQQQQQQSNSSHSQDAVSFVSTTSAPALAVAPDGEGDLAPDCPSTTPAALGSLLHQDRQHLLSRYHWLGACLSERLKQFEDASQQYEACKSALTALSEQPDSQQSGAVITACGAMISVDVVDGRLEALQMIIIVEDGRRCLEEGRGQELVAHLSPLLPLSGTTSQLPLNLTQQLAGLDLMKEAATGPEAWQIQLQCLLATASIQLPPCRLASSPQHTPASTPAFSTAMLSTVTSLADDLKKQPAWVSRVQAEGYSQAAGLAELLARVQWQLLDLVQGLYASLSGRSSASPPRRSLDVKNQQQQKGLLQAFQLLLALRKLDPSLAASQSELQLLGIGASLFVEAGILGLAHGAYLKTCLQAFAPTFTGLASAGVTPGAGEGVSAVKGAAAKCIYLLYGLDLPEQDHQWTDGFQGKADSPDPANKEEAVLLWTFLVHFCASLTNSSKSFKSRLQDLLKAIQAQVPAPPQAVLAAFDLDDLLDSAAPASAWSPPAATSAQEVAPPMLMSSADMIAPASGETPPSADTAAASLHLEALEAAVRQDPDVSLHSHIYRMLAECEADVFEGLDNELMVQQQGHDLILDSLALARCELAYHPLRYEAWERVLNVYVTAGNALANAAVDTCMTVEQWRQSNLPSRHSLYCNRALSAIHFARLAAASIADPKERADTLAFLEEQVGDLALQQVQDALPLYDQIDIRPLATDPQYKQKCLAGLAAFQKAQLTLNEEWEFQLSIAKFLRKLGGEPTQVLHHLAKACHLANEFAGGSVEAVYQLHATRLKLLREDQPNFAALKQHCFLPELQPQLPSASASHDFSSVPAALQASTSAAHMADSAAADAQALPAGITQDSQSDADHTEAIFQDAMSAMEFCVEQSKGFHKARYRRAQALRWRGRLAESLAEVQPFFKTRSRHGFAIKHSAGMYIIPEGVKKAKKAYAAADSSKLEEEAAAEDASPSVPEVLWGQRVESLAVNGIEETPRKFLAHVRRALILYIHLLMDVGDLDTLCGAVRALRREATLYSDICRWAHGMYVIHLAAALEQACPATEEPDAAVLAAAPPQHDAALAALPESIQHTHRQLSVQPESARLPHQGTVQHDSAAGSGNTELLEKAFWLYHEACLSSDPSLCWEHAVKPALHAARTFHAPDQQAMPGDAAITIELFHKHALAYVHSLGPGTSTDKLQEIQKQTKGQNRRGNSTAADARHAIFTLAVTAERAVLETQLADLVSQAQEALQSHTRVSSNAAANAAAQPEAAEAPGAMDSNAAALHEFYGIQPAAAHQTPAAAASGALPTPEPAGAAMSGSDQPMPMQLADALEPASLAHESEAMQTAEQPDSQPESGLAKTTQLSGGAESMQASDSAVDAAQVAEPAYKDLLLALLKLMQRSHELGKSAAAKADTAQGPVTKAEAQMSRAYTAYLRLSRPDELVEQVHGPAAVSAVEYVLQQARAGVLIP